MRGSELLRLVWLNINQNRFKAIMTSIGIVVGAATIMLVIGIGRGGQMDIAEQFAELNAGAIDITYEYEGEDTSTSDGGFSLGGMAQFFANQVGGMFRGGPGGNGGGGRDMPSGENTGDGSGMPSGGNTGDRSGMPSGGNTGGGSGMPSGENTGDGTDMLSGDSDGNTGGGPGMPSGENTGDRSEMPSDGNKEDGAGDQQPGEDTGNVADDTADENETTGEDESETGESLIADRLNQKAITLTTDDVDAIETYVSGISGATISYTTRASVEGGVLTDAQTYTVAGVEDGFTDVGRLTLAVGDFFTVEQYDAKSKVCVLGASVATELFGSSEDAKGSTLYIEDRCYTVIGVLTSSNTVVSGISVDTALLIPYQTGVKYITASVDPTLTVIAEDVNTLQSVITDVETVLEERYPVASFTFSDSGSKMKAAEASNRTLTMLLTAMAAIVFLVGGIGIMNVLFVSVKERTNEIGILKAIGTPRFIILLEFLFESAAISLIGGVLGVGIGFGVIPLVKQFDVRVEPNLTACLAALGFAVLTGTMFGLYPAWKASRLEPVEALNAE